MQEFMMWIFRRKKATMKNRPCKYWLAIVLWGLLVGGTVADAMNYSRTMRQITTGTNPNVTIPSLDFMGCPTGIDVRKVIETGILPLINTAIAHKEAGIGMIGAGIVHPPMEAFEKAMKAIAEQYQ